MWALINDIDITDNVNLDINIQASISDPLSKMTFTVDDPGCLLNLAELQDVLIFDETLTDANGLALKATHNFIVNVFFENSGGGTTQVAGGWSTNGGNSTLFQWNNSTFNLPMVFSNSPVTYGVARQITPIGYVKPNLGYTFSIYITGSGTINNLQSIVSMDWMDAGQNVIGSGPSLYSTPSLGTSRLSVSGVAPTNAAYIRVNAGGQATNATNSGTITFTNPQLEPQWFTDEGVSYPTPLCNFGDIFSALMPDGTTSRANRVFAGYIDDLQVAYEGNNRTWTVSCAGPGAVLENMNLINFNYSVPTYDDIIINNVITDYYANILSTAAPHTQTYGTTVQRGVLVPSLTANDNTFREILNGLADASGYIFYVDNYYYLRYQPVYWDTTSITISDTPDYVTSYPPIDYNLEKDATQIKNRVKVVGGKFLAPAITDKFSPNGSLKTFSLSYAPYEIQSVTLSGAGQTVGVNGVNNYSQGYVALYDKGSQQLIYNTAPPSGTNTLLVTYTYEAPVAVTVQSLDSYALYRKWFDSKVNDTNLTSIQSATLRGLSELTKFAFPRPILTLSLNQYLYPGTTVLFTSQHDGYTSQPFTIQNMTITTLGNGIYLYQYTCGFYNPTFVDHMRNHHKALNRSQTVANVTAAVQTDLVATETIHYSDSASVTQQPLVTYQYGASYYGYCAFA